MKKQIIYSIIVLFMGLNLQAQVVLSDKNYVHTTVPQTPMTIAELENINCSNINDIDRAIESVTYFDGLGRIIQQRAIKASPSGNDIVTHITYDDFGRQDKQYLPFEASNTVGSYKEVDVNVDINQHYRDTYQNDFSGVSLSNINAYSESVFDKSPLNRVLEQGAPGKAWKADRDSDTDHTIKFDWGTNVANEVVYFKANYANPGNTEVPSLVKEGHYTANELYVTITKDENWTPAAGNNHTTKEYKDKQGRVVLKRTYASTGSATPSTSSATSEAHDTYYIYDDFDNLTYVISPKVTTDDGVSNTELAELCYQYKYDYRNRLVEKKIPGKDWEYIVYNKLDQPIMTQDANLKANNAWLYTKYDAFGRVAYTGTITDARDRVAIQTEATTYSDVLWIERIAPVLVDGVQLYYNDGGYPKVTSATVLTINYYDDYTILGSEDAFFNAPATVYGVPVRAQTKTLPVASKVRVLETLDWITTVTYYDTKSRPIYAASKNEYLNTTDVIETKLDFVGKVEETKSTHIKDSHAAIVTIDSFTYDHMGRMLTQRQCIEDASGVNCNSNAGVTPAVTLSQSITQTTATVAGNNITLSNGFHFAATTNTSFFAKIQNEEFPGELIVSNTYDNLGQLISKKVGGSVTPSGFEGLQTVDYRYNIRGWLKGINDVNNLGSDLFAFKINYNTTTENLGATALYNGNISETTWKTANDNTKRGYGYQYDHLNRITQGRSNDGKYNLSGITYDKVGNILSLNRKGHLDAAATSFGDMDKLIYTYDTGNKLVQVTDTGNTTYGFKDGTNTNDDFTYDANGNMILDQNKGITGITYNHLNLPKTVTINNADHTGNITYIYDATGVKLKKIATEGSSLTTEYAGNYIYKNGTLEFFNTSEGYVEKEADGYKYVYQFKDHLGNIRLSYKDANKDGVITTPTSEVFSDDFESASGWVGLDGYDTSKSKSGNNSGKIIATGTGDKVVHSSNWVTIENSEPTEYIFSGWIYSDSPNSGIFFFMKKQGETGYFTNVDAIETTLKNNWVYLEKKVLVPANIRTINIRLDNDGGGTVWFDDISVRRVNPSTVSEIVEEKNYYPFGMLHSGYNFAINGREHNYGFGNKEENNELGLKWLDFGARSYDSSIGRWMNIDPLAEIMEMDSPYSYAFNNPVFFIDSNGMMPWPVHEFFHQWTRRVDSWYGPRTCTGCSSFHRGLDINFSGGGATDFGAPVLATHTGRVVSIKTTLSGAGRNVLIQSPDGTFQTQYFHMSRIDVLLGSYVEEGQQVGAIGGSGRGEERGYAVHLHYAIKRQNNSGGYDWYNPTGGNANNTANIVDPQGWISYGPWEASYYDNIAGVDFSILSMEAPIGTPTPTPASRPTVTPISPLPSGGIVPTPAPPITPGGGTIPVPAPTPPNRVIIPPKPILD